MISLIRVVVMVPLHCNKTPTKTMFLRKKKVVSMQIAWEPIKIIRLYSKQNNKKALQNRGLRWNKGLVPFLFSGFSWIVTLRSATAGPFTLVFLLNYYCPLHPWCLNKTHTFPSGYQWWLAPTINRFPPQSQGFDPGYNSQERCEGWCHAFPLHFCA